MRDERGRYIKGARGNPSGRPPSRGFAQRVAEATADGQLLIDFAKAMLADESVDAKVRMQAAEFLADRMLGKPASALELSVERVEPESEQFGRLTDGELDTMRELALKMRGELPSDTAEVVVSESE